MKIFTKLLFFIFITNLCLADNIEKDSTKNDDKQRFLGIAAGISFNTVRDFGTSPLLYSGIFPGFQLEFSHSGKGNLFNYKFKNQKGNYIRATDDRVYSASGNIFELRLSYFRQLYYGEKRFANQYLGGSIGNYSEIRVNSAFMNAAFVFDNISSLWFNYKVEKKYTKRARQRNIFNIIKYKRKERTYIFSTEVSMPIYSLIYRPGYNYIGNATVNNDKILQDYKIYNSFFSGLSTDISFTRLWKNGNAIKYSYYWNASLIARRFENEVNSSKHFFTITLIYNLKSNEN